MMGPSFILDHRATIASILIAMLQVEVHFKSRAMAITPAATLMTFNPRKPTV
jgi:hypothetical protein